MPKIIETLQVNADFFKELTSAHGKTLSGLAEHLDISKQLVNSWMEKESIPTRSLPSIVEYLELSSLETESLFADKPNYHVLFRTRRNIPVMKSNRVEASGIGHDFFTFHESSHISKKHVKFIDESDPKKFAAELKRQLGIQDEMPVTTTGLIKILEQFNIHVIFVDFSLLFDFDGIKDSNAPAAFCLKESNSGKYSVVINLAEHTDDVLWILLHELTHIFNGDLEEKSEDLVEDEAQEKFCNKVASEILTPEKWFSERKDMLKMRLKVGGLSVFHVDEISRKLNSSFMGTILALDSNKIISSHTKSYLMKVYHSRKERRQKVYDFISNDYQSDKEFFWQNAFQSYEACNYLKMQNLFRKEIVQDSISLDRASEVFGVGNLGILRLKKSWIDDYEISTNL